MARSPMSPSVRSSLLLVTCSLVLCSLAIACSGSNDSGETGVNRIDCPGVDGTYYFMLTGTGECASLGTTVQTQGISVADQGVYVGGIAGCEQKASYAGCSIAVEFTCGGGTRIVDERTFRVGEPNSVTGTQTLTGASGSKCVYELYGSTDLAAIQVRAKGVGNTDDTDIAAISAYSAPSPSEEPTVIVECTSMVQHEQSTCSDATTDATFDTNQCVKAWRLYDAAGCGAAWRAYAKCRSTATLDCDSGESAACSVFLNAYFSCQSSFVSSTACTVAGTPATLCSGGLGTYSYACLQSTPPFPGCSAANPSGAAVNYFCCY